MSVHLGVVPAATRAHERWSMDFVHDTLMVRRTFRVLTVVDQWSRWSPVLEVGQSLSGRSVVEALDRVLAAHGTPASITVDYGTEFTSRALDEWAYRRGIKLYFTRPEKPTDKGDLRVLMAVFAMNVCELLSIEDARSKIDKWRDDYNHRRPNSSLGHLTPSEYVQRRQGERTQKPGNSCSGSI